MMPCVSLLIVYDSQGGEKTIECQKWGIWSVPGSIGREFDHHPADGAIVRKHCAAENG